MAGKKPVSKSTRKVKKTAAKPTAKPAAARSKPAPAKATPAKAPPAKASPAKPSTAAKPAAAKTPPAPKKPAGKPAPIARALRKNPAPVIPIPSGDFEDMHSLLAGPRNVTPYIAKRGERYMNAEQLRHFKDILQSWKRDLMQEVDRTVTHMKDEAANFPDPNDRATQEEEFSLELRTRDRERKLIRKIDEALSRIDDGSYGYCLETGEEIGLKRLEARPVATLTIEAQERRERRERQYGDRDDRYR